jgi:methionyl-tRNA formyltransferase
VLPRWERGEIEAIEQDETEATYAPQIQKTDALINWDRDDAATIARQVRAYNPWPMAYSYLDGAPLRIVEAVAMGDASEFDTRGLVVEAQSDANALRLADIPFAVIAAVGALGIRRVQPPGGRVMDAAAFLRGHREIIGKRLISDPETRSV